MDTIVDCDQHLYETRSMWADHIDPAFRSEALGIVDDERGYSWLTWRDRPLDLADVHLPKDTGVVGRHRARFRSGEPPEYRYDEALPTDYWSPADRVRKLDAMGIGAAVVFPNFGLLWERRLSSAPDAMLANMAAWNRWCCTVAGEGARRLHPVAHLSLRDPAWLLAQLPLLAAAGIRFGMIAPASVNGLPLSHPDHDRLWAAFVDHGITPVFHVADQPRLIDDAFYTDPEFSIAHTLESVFLWVPPAVAITDLIVNGTFQRHPGLRVGIVELSSVWVPQYQLMLDGGWDFTSAINGRTLASLDMRPSEFFLDRVRVASFSYEQPARLAEKCGDLFMCCSDYPHSEGTDTPIEDYASSGCRVESDPGLFGGNLADLLSYG